MRRRANIQHQRPLVFSMRQTAIRVSAAISIVMGLSACTSDQSGPDQGSTKPFLPDQTGQYIDYDVYILDHSAREQPSSPERHQLTSIHTVSDDRGVERTAHTFTITYLDGLVRGESSFAEDADRVYQLMNVRNEYRGDLPPIDLGNLWIPVADVSTPSWDVVLDTAHQDHAYNEITYPTTYVTTASGRFVGDTTISMDGGLIPATVHAVEITFHYTIHSGAPLGDQSIDLPHRYEFTFSRGYGIVASVYHPDTLTMSLPPIGLHHNGRRLMGRRAGRR